MENNAAGADDWRGAGGPLDVADVRGLVHPLCETWLAACEAAGLARNPDFNGARQDGVGIYQITTRRRGAGLGGDGLPAAGDAAGEPEGRDRGAGDAAALRRAAGGRGRLPARRRRTQRRGRGAR